MMTSQSQAKELAAQLEGASATDVLAVALSFSGKVAFASSLGLEDQVITHVIAENGLGIPIFTLDTGRLFEETYDLIERTESRYGIRLKLYSPNAAELERMVTLHGVNLFRDSVAARRRCCAVRKLEPLARALSGLDAWVCGLRKDQSVTREHVAEVEWDEVNGLVKFNPLARWTGSEVRAYVAKHGVPYNTLHDAGMPSIGCAPCTRAVALGADARSGRWWWESAEHRECGLHARDGQVTEQAT